MGLVGTVHKHHAIYFASIYASREQASVAASPPFSIELRASTSTEPTDVPVDWDDGNVYDLNLKT